MTSPDSKVKTRIQFTANARGKKTFTGYLVTGQNMNEHIQDLEKAIERAQELRFPRDVRALAELRPST